MGRPITDLPDKGKNLDSYQGLVGVGAWLATSVFYVFTTGQHSFFLDSTEFVTVAANAGVAHPPGTPLYALLASLATLVPIGPVAFRVHALNAVLGGAVAWLLFWIGCHVALRTTSRRWLAVTLAAAVALASALSPAIWFQSVRAEVYALNSVTNLAMVLLALRYTAAPWRTGLLALMGLAAGLGLGNHHFLTLLTGFACLVYLLTQAGARSKLLSKTILLPIGTLVAGMLVYLYLPVRAVHGWLMWGDPTSLSGLMSVLSAEAFHISVTEMPKSPFLVALLVIFEKWIDLMGFPLFMAGAVGLAVMLLKHRGLGLLLLLLVLAGGVSKAIMYLDVENPDDHAYFLAGIQALALSSLGLLSAPALLKLKGKALRIGHWGVAGLVFLGCAGSGVSLYSDNQGWVRMDRMEGPDAINRQFHESVPPDTLFMPSYYASYFNHLYFREVEKRRPDVIMVHQSFYSRFAGGRAYARDIVARYPELEPVFAEYFETGYFPLASLTALAGTRPVLLENDVMAVAAGQEQFREFELGDGGLTVPANQLLFSGPGVLLQGSKGAGWWEARRQHEFWTDFYSSLGPDSPLHPELAKLLVWYHYRNALGFINKGHYSLALLEVRLAGRLHPDSERISKLDQLLANESGEQ